MPPLSVKISLLGSPTSILSPLFSLAMDKPAPFWLDFWSPGTPLADQFPALFSHSTRPNVNVASVFRWGCPLTLFPPLIGSIVRGCLSSLHARLKLSLLGSLGYSLMS
jgi:hypothetical protein